jgi:hypothetical protein
LFVSSVGGGDDDLAFKNGFDLTGTGGGTFVAKAERIKKNVFKNR